MTNPGSPQGDRGLLRLPGVVLRVRPGCVGAAACHFNRPSAWWPGADGVLLLRGLRQSASLDRRRRVRACISPLFADDLGRDAAHIGLGVVITRPCVFNIDVGVLIARTSTSMSGAGVMKGGAVILISGAGAKIAPQVALISGARVFNVEAGVLTTRAPTSCSPV